jgi:hypothetical protein
MQESQAKLKGILSWSRPKEKTYIKQKSILANEYNKNIDPKHEQSTC